MARYNYRGMEIGRSEIEETSRQVVVMIIALPYIVQKDCH